MHSENLSLDWNPRVFAYMLPCQGKNSYKSSLQARHITNFIKTWLHGEDTFINTTGNWVRRDTSINLLILSGCIICHAVRKLILYPSRGITKIFSSSTLQIYQQTLGTYVQIIYLLATFKARTPSHIRSNVTNQQARSKSRRIRISFKNHLNCPHPVSDLQKLFSVSHRLVS